MAVGHYAAQKHCRNLSYRTQWKAQIWKWVLAVRSIFRCYFYCIRNANSNICWVLFADANIIQVEGVTLVKLLSLRSIMFSSFYVNRVDELTVRSQTQTIWRDTLRNRDRQLARISFPFHLHINSQQFNEAETFFPRKLSHLKIIPIISALLNRSKYKRLWDTPLIFRMWDAR